MPPHSVLIIGCGSIGERHLRCFLRSGRARVTACDANEELLRRMADTYGVPTATNWEQALGKSAYDAAVICTPAPWHVPMALQAMKSGSHVLIEKPLSHSLQDVDALMDTAARSGRRAAVAYVYHAFPFLTQARDFIRQGELGPVLEATVTAGQPFHRLRPAYAQTYYRDHRSGGGAIQDALTHLANWVESVMGPTESLFCDSAHLALPGVTVEDTVHVSARHGTALVSYTLNQFQAPNETTIDFHSARGSVRIEIHAQRWGVYREGDSEWTWREIPPADRDAPFIAQANAFLDQLEGKPAQLCTLEAALQTLRFNLAALASADTGARVHCARLTA